MFRDAVIGILAAIAKQERVRLSLRTIAGLEKARALGRVGGRPRITCDRDKVLKLHAAGKSLSAVARQLGMSKTSVYRIVKGARSSS
jgi:DNA invertase Pin-like site-specific DNA recombinase